MAVLAFDRHRIELLKLHRDIDRLHSLANTLCAEAWHRGMKGAIMNAQTVYTQIQERRKGVDLSPEEDSVIEVKMNRLRGQLCFLGRQIDPPCSLKLMRSNRQSGA